MSTTRKFLRGMNKVTLSNIGKATKLQKVVSAVTAMGFVLQPIAAMASSYDRLDGGTNERVNDHVTNIWAGTVVDDVAMNVFKNFEVSANDIANMYFKKNASDTDVNNLVNLVFDKINVNGTVNAIQNSKIGGNLFFLSSDGLAVSGSGVINAGSLSVMTPTPDHLVQAGLASWVDKEGGEISNAFGGSKDVNALQKAYLVANWKAIEAINIPINKMGNITVKGRINTTNGIKFKAAHIDISKDTDSKSNPKNISPVLQSGILDFSSMVNTTDAQGKVVNANIQNLTATTAMDGSGDIVLSAVAESVNVKDDNFAVLGTGITGYNAVQADVTVGEGAQIIANKQGEKQGDVKITAEASVGKGQGSLFDIKSKLDEISADDLIGTMAKTVAKVDIDGKVEGNKIDIQANAENKYVNGSISNMNNFAGSLIKSYIPLDSDVNYVVMENKAEVNIGEKAELTAHATDGLETVTDDGEVTVKNSALNITANANMKASAGSAAAASKLGMKKLLKNNGNDLGQVVPNAGVTYLETDNQANVSIKGSVTSAGGSNIAAKAEIEAEAAAAADAPSPVSKLDSNNFVNAAVTIADIKNSAQVDITSAVEASDALRVDAKSKGSYTTAAEVNAGETSMANTAINITDVNSSAKVNINGSLQAKNIDITAKDDVENEFTANNSTGMSKFAAKMATKKLTAVGGLLGQAKKKSLKAPQGLSKLGEMFTVGASVGVINETNKADVTIGKNAVIQATGTGKDEGKLNIAANTNLTGSYINVSGKSSNYKDKTDQQVMVNASVLVSNMDSSANVVVEAGEKDNGKHAVLQGKDITVNAGSEFTYARPQKMVADLKDLLEDIKTVYEADKAVLEAVEKLLQLDAADEENYFKNPSEAGAMEFFGNLQELADLVNSSAVDVNMDGMKAVTSLPSAILAFVDGSKYANFYVASSTAGRDGSTGGNAAQLAVAGAVNVNQLANNAQVIIGCNAVIKADGGDVALNAKAVQQDVTLNGKMKYVIPGVTSAGGGVVAVGGNVGVHHSDVNSVVAVAGGADISGENINIGAENEVLHIAATYGGGKGGSIGVSGMAAYMEGTSDSIAAVDNKAKLEGKNKLAVTAKNDTNIQNIIAEFAKAGGSAAGASVGYVDYKVNNIAAVANIDKNAVRAADDEVSDLNTLLNGKLKRETLQLGVDDDNKGEEVKYADLTEQLGNDASDEKGSITAKNVSVNAATTGVIDNITVAGSITGGRSSMTGSKQLKLPVNITGAGSASVNIISGNTAALLEDTTVTITAAADEKTNGQGAVNVAASDDSMVGAYSGAAALKKQSLAAGKGAGVALAGAVAYNKVESGVIAQLKNVQIKDAKSISNEARKEGAQIAVGLAAEMNTSLTSGSTSVNGAANASANEITNKVHAVMNNVTTSATGKGKTDVANVAQDKDIQIAGGITAQYAKNGGLGVGVAASYQDVKNDIQSKIIGGNLQNVGELQAYAASELVQVGTAVSVGVQQGQSANGVEGSVAINNLTNNVDVAIEGATINADSVDAKAFDGKVTASEKDNAHLAGLAADGFDVTGADAMEDVNVTDKDGKVQGGDVNVDTDQLGETETIQDKDGNDETKVKDGKSTSVFTASDNKGNLIITGATSVNVNASSGGTITAGAAVTANNIANSFNTKISGATITTSGTDGVSVKAESDTLMVGVTAGVAAAKSQSGGVAAGSAGVMQLKNNTTAAIENSTFTTDKVDVDAATKSRLINVAGQVSAGKGYTSIGLAGATNVLNNTTGAYIKGATINAADTTNGVAISANADNQSKAYAIVGAVTVATNQSSVADNGTVAVNKGTNNTEAIVDAATVTENGQQKENEFNNVKSINVNAKDATTLKAVAGGVVVGKGYASVGGAVAYNEIGDFTSGKKQNTVARLNKAVITSVKDSTIDVKAEDKSNLLTIAAGVSVTASQQGAAAQGSAATALVNKNTEASMTGTSVSKNTADDGVALDVNATTESKIITSADAISATTANAAGGAGVAVNRTAMDTKAFIDGGTTKKTITAKSVGVKAESKADITNVGIGAALTTGQGGSAASNVSVNNIANDTEAAIKNATITTKGSTAVLAKSEEHIKNYAGALAATVGQGYVAGGASVAVNTITGNTRAGVDNTVINAGNGTDISFAGKTSKGLVIAADSEHEIDNVVITAGIAATSEVGVAASGTVAVNTIKGATTAEITNSNTNISGAAGDVNVIADDSTDINSAVGALAVGVGGATAGVAAGASSDTNVLARNVTAQIAGTSSNSKNTVNADKLNVNARSANKVITTAVGAAAAGGLYGAAGVAGTVSVTKTDATTLSKVSNINSNNNGFAINANRTNNITLTGASAAATVAIGAGSLGMTIGVMSDSSTTQAQLDNANITHNNTAEAEDAIHAESTTNVTTALVSEAVSASIGGAIGGVVGVNNLDNKVLTTVNNSRIADEGKNAAKKVTVDAHNSLTTSYNTSAISAALGAGAIGVGVNTIDTAVVAQVSDSKLKAQNVDVKAEEERTLNQTAINAAVGGMGLSANVLVNNIGTAIAETGTYNGASYDISDVLSNVDKSIGEQNIRSENVAQNATKDIIGNGTDITDGFDDQLKGTGEYAGNDNSAIGNANVSSDAGLQSGALSNGLKAVDRGGSATAQGVQVIIDNNSEITASNKADIKANTETNTNITAGGATVGGTAASGTFSIINVKRNSGVTVENSKIAAKEMAIASKQAGTANMNIYQGVGGMTGINVAVGVANLNGTNKVTLNGATLSGIDKVDVQAEDASQVNVNAIGVTVGAVSLGSITAVADNDSTNDIVVEKSKVSSNETIDIVADKHNTVTAHATGGSAGMVSGSAIVAVATDDGTSSITLGRANDTSKKNKFSAKTLTVNAKASPAVKALADSAAVALTYGASAAVATATANGGANVTVNNGDELLVDEANLQADIYALDDKKNAEAKAEGNSGGGLVNVGANVATATTNTTANVTVGAIQGKTKKVETYVKTVYDEKGKIDENKSIKSTKTVGTTALNITSSNSTTTFADARGVNIGGIFSSGNNVAKTNNTSTTDAALNAGNSELLLGSLNVTASGASDNLTTADGSGGGLVSADLAAYVENRMNANTMTTVNGKLNVNGEVTINAMQNDRANLNADALKAAVVGASATKADNKIEGETKVDLNGLTLTGADNLSVNADNTVTVGDSKKYAVQGSGYGGVNVQGAVLDNKVGKKATINVGNAMITTAGAQGYEAKTTADITAGGYIKAAGVGAFTWIDVDNEVKAEDRITVGSGAKLKTTKAEKDITLAAVDNMTINAIGVADTLVGAAGGASSDVTNKTIRNNSITVANNAELYSMNDVNLYAGRDLNGADGKLKLTVDSEAYNKTALGLGKPKLKDEIEQNNNVTMNAGSKLSGVRNINLYADAGQETIRDTSVMYNWYYSDKDENYTSSTIGDNEPQNKQSNNYIQADGTLTAGVQNKQIITIGADGALVFLDKDIREGVNKVSGNNAIDEAELRNKITVSDGINKDDIVLDTMDYGTTLFERYEQLGKLMAEYSEDTSSTAYLGYKAEKERIFTEMQTMGLVKEITPEDGSKPYYAPVKGATIDYISLPDIVASGGNINITTDTLAGTGSLEAKGAPEVIINNNTNLYMKIKNVILGDAGGEINYNGVGLKSTDYNKTINELNAKKDKTVNFSKVTPTAETGSGGTITINGNYGGSYVQAKATVDGKEQLIETKPKADIEINGYVNAKNGSVNITSLKNNIIIQGTTADSSAGVSGSEVHLTAANGSVSQGYTDGITSIGGNVQDQYKSKYNDLKNQFDKIYGYEHTENVKGEVKTSGKANDLQGNMIVGENIYINAADININGYMQSGYADYEVTIDDSVNALIDEIKKNYKGGTLADAVVTTGDYYRVIKGGNIKQADGSYKCQLDVYYNPSTGKLVVPDVDANGGKIYLTGRISSTGGGKINALDGAYDIKINNTTDNTLQVGRLVSNKSDGLISITDTGRGKLTEITRSGAKEYDIKDIDKQNGTTVSNTEYKPKEGLRYNWTTGQNVSTSKTYQNTIKAGLWGAVETMDKTKLTEFEQNNEPIKQGDTEKKDKLNGEYIGTVNNDTVNGSDFSVIYDNKVLKDTQIGPGEPERWSSGFLGWFKWERYTWTRETGTSQQYVASVKADNTINIGFIGKNEGKIDVSSNGSLDIAGKLASTAGGSINLTSQKGSISQNAVNMVSDNVSLSAATGINNIGITSIGNDVKLSANNSNSGNINITVAGAYGKAGNVLVGSIVNNGNDEVRLTVDGNINQSGTEAAIVGKRIDLISNNGTIGNLGTLKIKAGTEVVDPTDSLSASINANAKGDIDLTQTEGDMRVGQIKSTQGNVTITVENGNVVDALPDGEVIDRGDTEALIQKWKDLGLIAGDGSYTAKQQQDVEDYKANVKDEFARYKELKAYYENKDNKFTQTEQTAYESYKNAKASYDSLTKEFKDYQNQTIYYADDKNIPQEAGYRTKADYNKALEVYKTGKAAYNELKAKCAGSTTAEAYAQSKMTADAWNSYNEPKVGEKDMKSAFGSYDSYQDLQSRYNGFTDADAYLNSAAAQNHIKELTDTNRSWTENQLLYAIQDSIINPTAGSGDNIVKNPNLMGKNITVNTKQGSVGLDSDKVEEINLVGISDRVADLKKLVNASASTVTWDKANGKATITPKNPLGMQLTDVNGTITVTAKDNVYISGRKDETSANDNPLNIDTIKTDGNVRLQSNAGIYNLHNGEGAAISGKDLLIQGGEAGVGKANRLMTINTTGKVTATGTQGVYLEQVGDNALQITSVAANGDIVLKAKGDILSADEEGTSAQGYIENEGNTGTITINAGGSAGSAEHKLRIKNADDANADKVISVIAGKDVYLQGSSTTIAENAEPNGTMFINSIAAKGTVDVAVNGNINIKGAVTNNASGNITLAAEKSIDVNAGITNADNGSFKDNAKIIISARNNVNLNDNAVLQAKKVNLVASAVRNTGETAAEGSINQTANSQIITDKVVAAAMNGINLSSAKNTLQTVDVANMGAGAIDIANDGKHDLTVIIGHRNDGDVTVHNYQDVDKASHMKVEAQTEASGKVSYINEAGNIVLLDKDSVYSEASQTEITNNFGAKGSIVLIKAVSGDVTNTKDIIATTVDVNITTTGGKVTNTGNITATTNVNIASGKGDILNSGKVQGTNVSLTTAEGNITSNGTLTSTIGDVTANTKSGNIELNSHVTSAKDVSLTTGKGSITTNGTVTANNNVNYNATNGITATGNIEAITGKATINSSGAAVSTKNVTAGTDVDIDAGTSVTMENVKAGAKIDLNAGKNITTNGNVTANNDITYDAKGSITAGDSINSTLGNINLSTKADAGNMTFGGNIKTDKGNIGITAKENGSLQFNGNVITDHGNIDIIVEGNGNILDNDKLFSATGEKGGKATGNIKLQVKSAGDVDLNEIFATNDASVDVANGNLMLAKIDGNLVAIQLRTEGKKMEVKDIIAGAKIVAKGSNMDLDKIKQRLDVDGMLTIVPDGAKDDAPIDNLRIGEIATNTGVRLEHLWLNNGSINVSKGRFHIDKLVVNDNAHFSNAHMTTAVWGNPPQRDHSDSVYWNNTAVNNPKDNLSEWQAEDGINAEKWMYLHFTEVPNLQLSNGVLLDLHNYFYVYDQRFTAVDHLNQLLAENKADEYDINFNPEVVRYFRYDLYDLEQDVAENAASEEVIVEA